MSNVYIRKRKKSQYEKFLINKKIQKELLSMYNVKNKRYFPNEYSNIYYELMKINNHITKDLGFVYSERVRNSSDNTPESLEVVIKNLNEVIDLCEAAVQILQNYYMTRELHKGYMNKTKITMGRRFQELVKLFLKESEEFKSYTKSMKKKLKNNKNKEVTI